MILSWGDVVSSIAGLQVFIGSCAQSDLFPGLDGRRDLGIAIPSTLLARADEVIE